MGSGDKDPNFLDLSTTWLLVVSFMPYSVLLLGKKAEWVPEPVWMIWRKDNS
jgi:hypothetical protein